MAKKSSGASELANAKAEWKKLYHESDPKNRIDGAFKISKSANALIKNYGKGEVRAALKEVVGGDTKTVAQLLRLDNSFKLTHRNTAKNHFGKGASRSHLLTLTAVLDADVRWSLFQKSVEEEWSTTTLDRNKKGHCGALSTVKTTLLATSVLKSTNSLIEALKKVKDCDFAESVLRVRTRDRKKLNDTLKELIPQLIVLDDNLKGGRRVLEKALQAVAKRMK